MKQKTTMSTKPLTQQQVDYIRAHVNDRPRVKVARDAGVSLSTVYRIVREAGGEMRYEHTRRNPEHVEIIRRCYPVMTTREIADRYGIGYGRVNKIARELGVRHDPEVQARQERERNARQYRPSRQHRQMETQAQVRRAARHVGIEAAYEAAPQDHADQGLQGQVALVQQARLHRGRGRALYVALRQWHTPHGREFLH